VISAGAFSNKVFHSLAKQGYKPLPALNMSQVYGSAYNYLRAHWSSIARNYSYADNAKTILDAGQGYKTMIQATTLINNGTTMNVSMNIMTGLSDARLVGVSGILSGTVTAMQFTANYYHVPLNDCALSVAKVSMDLVGVVGGGLTAEFGPGTVLAVMSIISGVSDTGQLISACTARAN